MTLKLLTNAQMADADQKTIEAGVFGFDLMKRAGYETLKAAQERFQIEAALILCGPGNNGGDGFVIAKLLRESGYPVRVGVLSDKYTGDAALARGEWDGDVIPLIDIRPRQQEVVFDALFGTGLSKALDKKIGAVLSSVRELGNTVIAVDIPSGVNGDTGKVDPYTLPADLTVTFQYKKLAHVLYPGAALCGDVVIADIGIQDAADYAALENTPELWQGFLPRKTARDHKYNHGHALVYGAPEMSGATRLASEACARIGAGLTTVLGGAKADVYRCCLPAHIIVRDDLNWSDKRVSARLYGSGGLPCEIDFKSKVPTVLDADALSDLPKKLGDTYILTPHEGEFERAFPKIKGSKCERALAAAKTCGAIIVLKGADTVIASPDARVVVNTHASLCLASAGTGDVLAGMITGLLAQGMPPFEAACAGVWMHGECGVLSGAGLVASDLEKSIPIILKEILGKGA